MTKRDDNPGSGVATTTEPDTHAPAIASTPLPSHRIPVGIAVAACLAVLYAYGWGAGIANALHSLTGNAGPGKPGVVTVGGQGANLMRNLLLSAVAAAVFLALRKCACGFVFVRSGRMSVQSTWRQFRTSFRLWWRTGFMYCYCMLAGFVAIDIASSVFRTAFYGYPFGTRFENAWAAALYLMNMFFAGPTEELVLLGIVVVGLRYVNLPWWLVTCVAVCLRVPFHLYYGWAAFAIGVWPVLAVMLYRRIGMITPLIVAHGMYDVSTSMVNLNGFAGSAWPEVVGYAIMAMPVVWAVVAAAGRARRRWGRR